MKSQDFVLSANRSDMSIKAFWYVRMRWFFLLAVGIPGILSNFVGEGLSEQVRRDIILLSVALFTNLIAYLIARMAKSDTFFAKLAAVMIAFDIVVISALIFIKGGVESRSPILYTIPLLMSSAIFGKKGVLISALACILLYDFMIYYDYLGVIQTIGAYNSELSHNSTYVINTIAFFTSVIAVVAAMAEFITSLIMQKEKAVEASARALEEAQHIARVGSWSWDIQKDNVEWSNQLYELFSIDRKKLSKHFTFEDYLRFVYPADREMIETTVSRSLKSKESFSFEHRVRIGTNIRWLQAEGKVTTDSNGNPIRMTGTAQDITDRKIYEESIKSKAKELEKINSLMVGRELRMIELKKKIAELERGRKGSNG